MRYSSRIVLSIFLPLILCSTVQAQWTQIGDRTLGVRIGLGSALAYVDGHLWAGHRKLMLTTDDGATWTDHTPSTVLPGANVIDIEFFDRDHGAFVVQGLCGLITGCDEDALFITTDGGITWAEHDVPRPGTVTYMGSPDSILVAGRTVATTFDGGTTWRSHAIRGEWAVASVYFGNGKAGIFVSDRNRTSYVYFTNNYGQFWDRQRSFIDYDCYDMIFDSCSNTLFVVNEEWMVKEDNAASAIISSDMGDSWNTVCSFPYPSNTDPSITGAVDITPYAWYLQTSTIGVIRSTDRGTTWRQLGGPNAPIDTRTLAVPYDNLIYAVDMDGSVWMTTNGGGRPMTSPSTASLVTLSRDELFGDSIARVCSQPIVDELMLNVSVCGTVLIKDITIIGGDSAIYEILENPIGEIGGQNRLSVAFIPTRDGHFSSTMIVTFIDGTEHRIPLGGTADLIKIPLRASLSDVTIDTLGEHAEMELSIEPADLADDIIVKISYDQELQYGGAFTHDGIALHIPPANGSVSFTIPGNELQATLPDAIIRFNNVTAVPRPRYTVTIDSLSSVSQDCYTTLALETSDITVPVECGTILLSRYLRNERVLVAVHQDHDKRDLIINSSEEGHYTVSLIDMLGTTVLSQGIDIDRETSVRLDYRSLMTGTYLVVVRGMNNVSSHRVQVL